MSTNVKMARVLILIGLLAFGGSALAQDESGSVPMLGGNAARTGQMPGPGPDPDLSIVERWRFNTGDSVSSSPAVVGGAVYVGSDDGNLYALDAASGSERWRFTTGDFVSSSPAVVGGAVYVGSHDGNLYALDAASGSERWRFTTGDGVQSSPAVLDGAVYFGSRDGNIYALDAANGNERWRFANTTSGRPGSSSPAAVGGVVYVGGEDNVYALDAASGSEHWRSAACSSVDSSPAVADGVVYVGNGFCTSALDAVSGNERWRFENTTPSVRARSSSVAALGDTVYVGSEDGNLYALDAVSGIERWRFETEGSYYSESPQLAAVGELVYIGNGADGNIYALDAVSGNERWRFETEGSDLSSPAVVGGLVYVGSSDGNVYALGNPTETTIATQAASETREANDRATAEAQRTVYRATAEAQEAVVQATAEAERALEQTWTDYFAILAEQLRASNEIPTGLSIGELQALNQSDVLLAGWTRGIYFPVDLLGDGDQTSIVLSIYDSKDAADAAYDTVTKGLLRAGWQSQDVDGIDNNHTCLSLVRDGGSTAICYVTRDKVIITAYSFLPFDAADSVLLNAVDLAIFANGVYDEVDRPF